MTNRFALAVNRMTVTNQVLVLGHLAGYRNGDRRFTVGDVTNMFNAFRIPVPTNTSARLSALAKSGSAVRQRRNQWVLTPIGEATVEELLANHPYEQIAVELAQLPGANFLQAMHSVIPPELAPQVWQTGIKRLLDRFPFEGNVFLMTRFPDKEPHENDPICKVIDCIRSTVSLHGMNLLVASDRQANDDLFGNVGAHMWASQYGIGLLENHGKRTDELNDNVLIELGSMLVTGRRCAILKDPKAPSPPTDFTAQIYKSVDFHELHSVEREVHHWIADDLALGRCSACP